MTRPLRFLSRSDIDLIKYDACINQSVNASVYALSWYLDIVAEMRWDCLVWGDYEAVMPLPYQKIMLLKLIVQPPYCQQLGVYYKSRISRDAFSLFSGALQKKYVRSYCWNSDNTAFFLPLGRKRQNHLLRLNRSYPEMFSGFNLNRKRVLSKKKEWPIRHSGDVSAYFKMVRENYADIASQVLRPTFGPLVYTLLKKKAGILTGAFEGDNAVAFQLLLYSHHRLIALSSARDKRAAYNGASSFIWSDIIEKHAPGNLTVDFEGSDIPGVARFNESFGAEIEYYTEYRNFHWIERLKKLLHRS